MSLGDRALGLLRATRPRQWTKNVLVLAAPLASGRILEGPVARATLVALACFLLASAGTYLVNDAIDAPHDRAHPVKRLRPVASGLVPVRLALVAGGLLQAAAIVLAAAAGTVALATAIAVYVGMTLAYCLYLKHQPVFDLAVVAGGFLLRAMAGGLAASIPLSTWFLIVAAFGSLFMVAGKRYSEHISVDREAGTTRPSLEVYSASYLRFVWMMAATVTIAAYCIWAFEIANDADSQAWSELSVVPMVLALLRYGVWIDSGRAGEPEDIVLRDRALQLLAVAWLALFCLEVFSG